MASLTSEKNAKGKDLFKVRFFGTDKERHTLRLGAVPKKTADHVLRMVELIVSAQFARGTIPDEAARWLAEVDGPLRDRMIAVGLCQPKEPIVKPAGPTLGPFLETYIADRKGVLKPGTLVFLGHVQRNLLDCFGADTAIDALTEADADKFRLYLHAEELSKATIARRCGVSKTFLQQAVKGRHIDRNPFADFRGGVRANKDRHHFVDRATTAKILDACPDADWRLIVALARFGGVRTPSEILTLKLTDVNWETGRIRITSPKTEHHHNGAERIIPLFPELRPYLQKCWDLAPVGATHFIKRYSVSDCHQATVGWKNTNLRTQFTRILRQAGIKQWPRLFHALRASRETELVKTFPIHLVAQWMGHSTIVAAENYLMIRDEDYTLAITTPTGTMVADQTADHQLAISDNRESSQVIDEVAEPVESLNSHGFCEDSSGRSGIRTHTHQTLDLAALPVCVLDREEAVSGQQSAWLIAES